MRNQKGFTLIELVFVIVILGILAAFAIPRFTDLSTQARFSSITAVLGSVRAASAQAHAAAIATNVDRTATGSVTTEGGTIALVNGYAKAGTTGILAGLNLSDEYTTATTGTTTTITLASAANTATCNVTYTEATAVNTPPVITAPTGTLGGC